MSQEYKKEVKLLKDDGSKEVVMGAKMIKHDLENNISGFARPDKDGGNPIYKAFNINQIKETFEVKALLSDKIADLLNSDASLQNKEDAKDRLVKNFKSADLLRLKIKDLDKNRVTTNETGFMEGLSTQERAERGNADYEVTIDFLRSEKQGN